ncbi:MAG TPA: FHA domain-containing protein [Kofleriaceae bacterium]|nr:FHA domain-containing protein [Kofleriaceae bacterium]
MPVVLEIVRADGRIHREVLPDDRSTVGSSEQASVCVADAPELEPLHLLVVPRESGVWLSCARNARTPVLLDGKPFESGQLGLGTEVDIGSITFRVVAAQTGNRKNWIRNAVVLVVAAAIAIPLLSSDPAGSLPRSNAPAPPLFPDEKVQCPAAPDVAERRGLQAAERARSKTLRYPFDAREGLSAVELYRAAAPCLVGSDRAKEVAAEEQRLRQRIEDDYQMLRLHLDQALNESDWEVAMAADRQLLQLLSERSGEYRDWLASVHRFLDLRLSEKKKDEPGKKERPR